MSLNVGKVVSALSAMTVAELRQKYAEVFGEETKCRHKRHLLRRVAWRMQANEEGGLSERARARARELAADSDVRLTPPPQNAPNAEGPTFTATVQLPEDNRLPMPGAQITRVYKGELIVVDVLPRGFSYKGEVYRSLTAVARAVTGTHWNGYDFFGLGKKGDADSGK